MLARISRFFSRTPARPLGEATARQGNATVWGMHTPFGQMPGICASAGTYDTYRDMRTDPTIALARAVGTAAIKAADYSIQADDDAPDDAVRLIQDTCAALWSDFVRDAMFARDFGWMPFEKIWTGESGALTIERMKALRPEESAILADGNGAVVGLRNGKTVLWSDKSFVYTYDSESGNPYGRSLFENIRQRAWDPWVSIQKQNAAYFSKAAGVIPMINYPLGKSPDENGSSVDHAEIAKRILANLTTCKGVILPWQLESWAQDLARRSIDPEKLMSWQIKFLETQSGHGEEFLGSMRYYDSLKMRGLLVPERAAIEGQSGTKAEADSHGNLAIQIQELDLLDLWKQFNRRVIDDVLSANFGPAMKGKVYGKPAPLIDEDAALVRQIVASVLTNPQNIDLLYSATDLDAMLDQTGVPKAKEVVQAPNNPALPPKPGDTPAPDPATVPSGQTKLSRAISLSFRRGFGIGKRSGTPRFAPLKLNCGTGDGGFQPGNSCAGDGSGGGGSSAIVGKVDAAHARSIFKKAQEDNFSLPIDQNQAVANYTGAMYTDINNQLRSTSGKKGGGHTGKLIGGIDAAFAGGATETKKHTVLFRGFNAGHTGDLKPGTTITDHGFVSTSVKESFATDWATKFKKNSAVAEIVVPKGTKVLGGDAGQHELILNRGSKFRVQSVSKETIDGVSVTRIKMELIHA